MTFLEKLILEVVGFACDDKFRSKKQVSYADIYHSANRYSVGTSQTAPIVLPRTLLWSFQHNRLLLGRELLRSQGLSFEPDMLAEYSESQLGNLAGNAWFGLISCICFILLLHSTNPTSNWFWFLYLYLYHIKKLLYNYIIYIIYFLVIIIIFKLLILIILFFIFWNYIIIYYYKHIYYIFIFILLLFILKIQDYNWQMMIFPSLPKVCFTGTLHVFSLKLEIWGSLAM